MSYVHRAGLSAFIGGLVALMASSCAPQPEAGKGTAARVAHPAGDTAPMLARPDVPASPRVDSPTRDLDRVTRYEVVGITDGDTLQAVRLPARKPLVKIRLRHVDAPEKRQAFGTRAKQALARLVFRKRVVLRQVAKDRYGRTLAEVLCEGKSVNLQLVRDGWAWHFTKYSADQRFAEAEVAARRARRGLWAGPDPVAPWEWRKPPPHPERKPPVEGAYWINAGSKTRHNDCCEWYGRTKKGHWSTNPREGKACGICGG